MAFTKGKSGNPNGRPKGSKNKATSDLREFVLDFLECNKEKVQRDFDALEPKDRAQLYFKVMEYALPKLQATKAEHKIDNKTKNTMLFAGKEIEF